MLTLLDERLADVQTSGSLEWLETNGIGGYASGTVAGLNSRRYHGYLVAATKPPVGRAVLLSKYEETLVIGDERFELSCNRFGETIAPKGYRYLVEFRLDPCPIWTYRLDNIEIEKTVFMVNGRNSTVCTWEIKSGSDDSELSLEVRPLLAFRDHHHLRENPSGFDGRYTLEDGSVRFEPVTSLPPLFLSSNAASVVKTGHWYRDLEYTIESERGFDHREELYQPCVMIFDLKTPATIIASTEKLNALDSKRLKQAEMKRRAVVVAKTGATDEFSMHLALAADQFIVSRGSGKTVMAGYHWFSDWGRDTMIALPGLTLATGRPEIAKSILREFAEYLSMGMIPNRFPDEGSQADYNTVDATLWFFEALRSYADYTGDLAFVNELYPKLVEVIDWHERGTRYGIHVDQDGLLYAGEPGVQLTWMDAKVGDHVITPRTGKPVEIQALWYNALRIMAEFASGFGETGGKDRFEAMAHLAKESFNEQFWNEGEECLFDVIDGHRKDPSIRPNQIFAISLPHSMIDDRLARKVFSKVESELLTPVGLRSLSPNDPAYVPRYVGSPAERDAAYHQGTVWAWLIGPFADAYMRLHANDPAVKDRIDGLVAGFRPHLTEGILGQISEIFDGDPPHTSRGCAAQAWSVSEVLWIINGRKG